MYDKLKAMGYPTDPDRGSRPHHAGSPEDTEASGTPTYHEPHPVSIPESNVPRAPICVPIEDETYEVAMPGSSTEAVSLASQRFENEGNNGYNASLRLRSQVADEHSAPRTAFDCPRHPAKEIMNDGTFGTSLGSVASANAPHQSKELPVGLPKMGPTPQRKRRNTSNTPEQEMIMQNLRKAGYLSNPQHSGGRSKPRLSKEATDFQTFLKISNRLDSQGDQPGKDTTRFTSHAHTMKKIRSLFDIKSNASKAQAKQNSPFADNDSGYQSGRRTPSTLHLRDSLSSHPESLTEFRSLYRVTCHKLHEPKRPDQHRDIQPCHYCGCSSIHILAWSANHMKLQEFEDELKSKDPDDVQALDAAGNSALHYAAASGASYDHLKALIDAGVPLYARNTATENFLHCLRPCNADAKSCSLDCFKFGLIKLLELIEPKFAFGQQDNDGQTILHVLASHITEPELREQTFDIFTRNQFPPIVLNRFGKSAKDIRPSTYQYGQTMFAADTFNTTGTSPPNLESSGMSEWEQNFLKQMNVPKILIEAHHNPHYVDNTTKDTILHALSRVSVLSIGVMQKNNIIQDLRQFVAKGVNLNRHNRDGHHPLAAFICNQDFRGSETGATMAKYIDILLWKGGKHGDHNDINVNMMSRNGATALHEAAIQAQSDTVRSLIEAGANVNARFNNDPRGLSVLQATIAARNQAVQADDHIRHDRFKNVISHLEHAGAVLQPTSLEERGRPM